MSYSKLSIIALFFVLSSCAFNGLFLHPYKLSEESSFNGYSKQLEDTITLSFAGDQPQFHRSNSDTANLDYTIKSINFESKTSDTLNAWLLEPKSNFNGTLIYWLHGNAGHIVYQYQLVTPFVEKGFKVFMIDYSGFGFSSGEATRKNTLQNGCDGFEFMKGMNIPHEKTLIYGQSLGGHLASVVAPLYQDQLDGLVIEGAFNSHKAVASTRVPILPWVFVSEMYKGQRSIRDFHKPFLSIHSVNDRTVKYKLGKRLYDHANEPKEHFAIDSCHVCGPLYYRDSIVNKMQNMVK